MENYKGIEYLRRQLNKKRTRVLERYRYYDMKNIVRDFHISTPPDLYWVTNSLGWCGKAVDALADRLIFNEFREDNFDMNSVFNMNNPDTLYDSAILAALIGSCSFIHIIPDDDGYPRMTVIDGSDATGVMDPITGLLKEGYAVLERDDNKNPIMEAYFLPHSTAYIRKGRPIADVLEHDVEYPLLVPIVNKADYSRPFGHSRISRACMSLTNSAIRTVKRSEIGAEFYSYPQKWVTGMAEDAEVMDKWKATMSSLITLTKDEDGDHPIMGQFAQQSMTPHIDHLKMFASMFAGETGLTTDDLGFPTANPSSAEAIKASHDALRLTARKAQRKFGSGLLNAGYLAVCLRDNTTYKRSQVYMTKPVWEPIFEPDAAMLSAIGDGVLKLNQAVDGYITKKTMGDLTGIRAEEE